ncbi:hypothetical protein [Pseudanabaena minima]|uniref:hypothetical protein n=1 Tax=Pseudanabaena minima TaxID=890415 RepID=UPI003DA96EC8
MKILLGSKLIVDTLLKRSTSNSSYVQTLCEIILSPSFTQFYITRLSLDMVHSLTSISSSVKNADDLVRELEFIFTICEVSPKVFEKALHQDLEIDAAIDLECCLELDINAIVTKSPEIYIGNSLSVWSVEQFIQRHSLENSFASSTNNPVLLYQQNHQLSLPFAEDKDPAKYMIRNRMPIIKKALAILKTAGFRGLTKQEFAAKLGSSETTTRSVIWDLERFGMALSYRDKVEIDRKESGKKLTKESKWLK